MTPATPSVSATSFFELLQSGGFVMIPLGIASVIAWLVIIEKAWSFRKMGSNLEAFHLEALNHLLRRDYDATRSLCARYPELPTAGLLAFALERKASNDVRVSARWAESLERRRQQVNHSLRSSLWVLGTISSAAPFIGLFGTVLGILRSFGDMAKTGSGGFAVVASGISESLIATAAGIIVAVVAVLAYNVFQTVWNSLVLRIRLQVEEFAELLEVSDFSSAGQAPSAGETLVGERGPSGA
jgi:biopolymer transport protein ExbB